MATEMQFLYTVVVDGQTIGVFDTMDGGDVIADEVKHRPGGMGSEVSYVALASPSAVTCTRVYERERDHELLRTLTPKAGRVLGSVTEQPLDDDGNTWGKPTVYSGRFLGVKRGNADSTSNDPRMLELDFSIITVS